MLEPDDVADFIMETGRTPELMCPDENCRLAMPHTRITSVCCDPRNRKCGVTPHFRTHTDHRHAENCQYEVLGRHTDYILGHKDEFTTDFPDANLLRKIKDIDTELLPDEYTEEFAPREFMEAVTRKAREYRQDGASKEQAFCRARCAVPQRTSRLGLVVDMALKLAEAGGDDLREKVRLSLPILALGMAQEALPDPIRANPVKNPDRIHQTVRIYGILHPSGWGLPGLQEKPFPHGLKR